MINLIRPTRDFDEPDWTICDRMGLLLGINLISGTFRTVFGCSLLFFAIRRNQDTFTTDGDLEMGLMTVTQAEHLENEGLLNIVKGVAAIASGVMGILSLDLVLRKDFHPRLATCAIFLTLLPHVVIAGMGGYSYRSIRSPTEVSST